MNELGDPGNQLVVTDQEFPSVDRFVGTFQQSVYTQSRHLGIQASRTGSANPFREHGQDPALITKRGASGSAVVLVSQGLGQRVVYRRVKPEPSAHFGHPVSQLGVSFRAGNQCRHGDDGRAQVGPYILGQSEEKVVLVFEIGIYGAVSRPGPFAHSYHPGAVPAVSGELGLSRI
jgi:hypothetical protein